MRHLRGGRTVAEPAAAPTNVYDDPTVPDPPIVAALVAPLRALRASLGTGAAVPHETITAALTAAAAHIGATEKPHRDGLHAVESTAAGAVADTAVPAMRTTATEIGALGEHAPAYLAALGAAHATTSTAAAKVDRIIDDFRADARRIAGTATAAPDNDAIIDRATTALRDAITTVTAAKTEMDGHTRTVAELGPGTLTTPQNWAPTSAPSWGPNSAGWPTSPGTWPTAPGGWSTAPAGWSTAPPPVLYPPTATIPAATAGMDPATAAQVQMQGAALQAGVQLGSTALQAGVQIGTDLIDKAAEVITHGIDTGGKLGEKAVDTAVPQLLAGATGKPATGPDGKPADPADPAAPPTGDGAHPGAAVFDFGGHPGALHPAPSVTGPGSLLPDQGTGHTDPPAGHTTPPPAAPVIPDKPTPPPATKAPDSAESGGHGTAGALVPPTGGTGGQTSDKPHRGGQLGVTVAAPADPAAAPAVIGKTDA
ncbi:hypothetical protein [Nocardia nova]